MRYAIALAALGAFVPASLAHAGPNARAVQIASVDFNTGVLELHNFDASDIDLDGWRFCSHDFDEARRYTAPTGLDGITIEAGTSVFIHFNNDAPADPDRVNSSSLGGLFALPLDQGAKGIQLYFPNASGIVAFGNSTLIADHLQWNDGGTVGSATFRTAQAVAENLWSANGDFIVTNATTSRIDLTDTTGGTDHSPANYLVSGAPQEGGCELCVAGEAADCFIATEADCLNAGGTYLGDGTNCGAATAFCPCDWDCDGFLNDQDFFVWVNDFFSGAGPVGGSDFNDDGFENDQDWFDFTNCFFNPPPECL